MPTSTRRKTTERGYGAAHQAERKRWEPLVKAGLVCCWRCTKPIAPNAPWDLGHDDADRTIYRGPEHPRCNRGAAAALGNAKRRRPKPLYHYPVKRTDLTLELRRHTP